MGDSQLDCGYIKLSSVVPTVCNGPFDSQVMGKQNILLNELGMFEEKIKSFMRQ